MKYQLSRVATGQTLQLQSIGHVIGQPAENIKLNDSLMWNFGEIETVIEVLEPTKAFVVIKCRSKSGYEGVRKLKKSRLVCILKD